MATAAEADNADTARRHAHSRRAGSSRRLDTTPFVGYSLSRPRAGRLPYPWPEVSLYAYQPKLHLAVGRQDSVSNGRLHLRHHGAAVGRDRTSARGTQRADRQRGSPRGRVTDHAPGRAGRRCARRPVAGQARRDAARGPHPGRPDRRARRRRRPAGHRRPTTCAAGSDRCRRGGKHGRRAVLQRRPVRGDRRRGPRRPARTGHRVRAGHRGRGRDGRTAGGRATAVRLGPQWAMTANAASFLVSYLAIRAVRTAPQPGRPAARAGIGRDYLAGLRVISGSRILTGVLLSRTVAILGAGAVTAGLLGGPLADRFGPARVYPVAALANGCLMLAYSQMQAIGPALPVAFAETLT